MWAVKCSVYDQWQMNAEIAVILQSPSRFCDGADRVIGHFGDDSGLSTYGGMSKPGFTYRWNMAETTLAENKTVPKVILQALGHSWLWSSGIQKTPLQISLFSLLLKCSYRHLHSIDARQRYITAIDLLRGLYRHLKRSMITALTIYFNR